MLTLHLLGGVRLEGPSGRLTGEATQRHRLALLALLALTRDGRLPRERLTTLLWPEHDDRRARDLLNSAVYVLRKALGRDAIRSEGDDLRLDPDALRCDAVLFRQAAEKGNAEAAVAEYAGPFMDAFFLDAARDFEQWQDGVRSELEQVYVAALTTLAAEAEKIGHTDEAIRRTRQLVRHRPVDRSATMQLMQLLASSGDRSGALAAAEDHGRALAGLFEEDPDEHVEALARKIREEPVEVPVALETADPVDMGELVPAPVVEEMDEAPSGSDLPPPSVARRSDRRAGDSKPVANRRLTALLAAAAAVVVTVGVLAGWPGDATPVDDRVPSVAVLPFVDMSPEGDFGYFGDGLTEELLNALARNPGLAVASRSSSFRFRGGEVDPREVGRSLRVASVVEGSVRVDGDRLRITAQLIDAATGYHLWSEQYDRGVDDVLSVQEEVALAVAAALSREFAVPFADTRVATTTTDPEAFRLYLLGRHQWRLRTEEGMQTALEAFQDAVEIDPDFAAAHAGLADVWQLLPDYADVASSEGMARAKTHALRAVALDSTSADAQAALAALLAFYDRDRPAAEVGFRRAVELNPRYVTARHWLALHLADDGRSEEALEEIERARRLDPLSEIVNTAVGAIRYFARDYDGAEAEYRSVLEISPDFALGWALLGRVQLVAGEPSPAVNSLERSLELSGDDPSYLAVYAAALAEVGRGSEAREIAEELFGRHPDAYVPYSELASAFLRLGEEERALALFQLALDERDPALIHMKVEPLYDDIREDERFRSIQRAMGL